MIEQAPGMEDIECPEIVYRALKKSWVDGTQVAAEAFIRRLIRKPDAAPGKQPSEDAVSLSRRKYATARKCRTKLKNMPYTATIHAGRIRALPLDVDIQPDPLVDADGRITDSAHCLLINLPDPNDWDSAESVASQIAKTARIFTAEQEEEEHRARTDEPAPPQPETSA
jgi:hypothetical protein